MPPTCKPKNIIISVYGGPLFATISTQPCKPYSRLISSTMFCAQPLSLTNLKITKETMFVCLIQDAQFSTGPHIFLRKIEVIGHVEDSLVKVRIHILYKLKIL